MNQCMDKLTKEQTDEWRCERTDEQMDEWSNGKTNERIQKPMIFSFLDHVWNRRLLSLFLQLLRVIRLLNPSQLEQVVSLETTKTPMTEHLRIVYNKVSGSGKTFFFPFRSVPVNYRQWIVHKLRLKIGEFFTNFVLQSGNSSQTSSYNQGILHKLRLTIREFFTNSVLKSGNFSPISS